MSPPKDSVRYLIVDMQTATVPYVAVVSHLWVRDGNKCVYPNTRGDISAIRQEVPTDKLDIYNCVIRKEFAREKLQRACEQSDITSPSEDDTRVGKGCRRKTPVVRYSPTPCITSEDSDDSFEHSYGSTQGLPPVPLPSGFPSPLNKKDDGQRTVEHMETVTANYTSNGGC
ncbi:uncharacterized protein LOC116923160 [Daphnia magna]|uniref:uncharacterized protein LOC116923160 n=1 Tax=Daphnia magna TaxID=35525 RepID=UPI001E1BAB27|nr:uncharacterized protein LOC116923160 [Daphnia magna]